MITRIIKGSWPEEITEKRDLRIKEALSYPLGTLEEKSYNVVCEVNEMDAYFLKPGKEYFRSDESRNIHDMTPGVGTDSRDNKYNNYSFGDIWSDLMRLSFTISEDSYKQLSVLIYRLAFFMDCEIVDGKVRFHPNDEVLNTINFIQNEIDGCACDFNVMEFLTFLDLLSWNEDVKYQISKGASQDKSKRNQGRINNLLSMISMPLILRQFVTSVLDSKDDPENIDFSAIVDIAQQFARTRGVIPMSNAELIKHLSPYLVK